MDYGILVIILLIVIAYLLYHCITYGFSVHDSLLVGGNEDDDNDVDIYQEANEYAGGVERPYSDSAASKVLARISGYVKAFGENAILKYLGERFRITSSEMKAFSRESSRYDEDVIRSIRQEMTSPAPSNIALRVYAVLRHIAYSRGIDSDIELLKLCGFSYSGILFFSNPSKYRVLVKIMYTRPCTQVDIDAISDIIREMSPGYNRDTDKLAADIAERMPLLAYSGNKVVIDSVGMIPRILLEICSSSPVVDKSEMINMRRENDLLRRELNRFERVVGVGDGIAIRNAVEDLRRQIGHLERRPPSVVAVHVQKPEKEPEQKQEKELDNPPVLTGNDIPDRIDPEVFNSVFSQMWYAFKGDKERALQEAKKLAEESAALEASHEQKVFEERKTQGADEKSEPEQEKNIDKIFLLLAKKRITELSASS